MRTWVDRFPERFEYELAEFKRRKLAFELDPKQLEEQGRVVLRGAINYKDEEVALEIRYPDLFPYLRPEVAAPDLQLRRHQHPFAGNLCLLDPSTRAWDTDQSAAGLVAERVPYLLRLLEPGAEADLRDAETPQGEPSSVYFPTTPGNVILVPQAAFEMPAGVEAGSGRINFSIFEPPQAEVRGLLGELVEKGRNRKSRLLARADDQLLARFGGDQLPLRWVRLEAPPAENTIEGVLTAIEGARAGFGSPPWQNIPGGQIAIAAAVFPEEVQQGMPGDAWLFVVRLRNQSGEETAHLVRGQRLSRFGLEERLPAWVRLSDATVALVGLGSVGGGLAMELARAGIGELRGLDDDIVEAGTTVRWPLGLSAAGRWKGGALARRMAQDYPYANFKATIHRLGQSAAVRTARQRSELDILDEFLNGSDLVIDATAEIGVQQALADLAAERQIPQVFVSTTEGAKGGIVARVIPGVTGCWMCLQMRLDDGTIPSPAADAGETVQPHGCGAITFVGAAFDILPVIAQGTRAAVATLAEHLGVGGMSEQTGYDREDVFIFSFAGPPPAPPKWSAQPLEVHPDCPVCHSEEM
jgi:molybdopterin/thiamine biosynthesis adenylyltransferase